MVSNERREDLAKYIEKYYVPGNDDILLEDKEVKSLFQRISQFRKKLKESKKKENAALPDEQENSLVNLEETQEFDPDSAKQITITQPLSETMATNRKINDLMSQMDETFSKRLIRMIRERGISEATAYKRAYVDRRHFSKIKKDEFYTPNKKTVLAFSIALELSLDETKDLLRSAGYALSRSSKFDIIIVYFLQNKIYDMFEINEVLYEYGQPIFE